MACGLPRIFAGGNVETTLDFFRALYGDEFPPGNFYVWVRWLNNASKTIWVNSFEQAIAEAEKYNGKANVYFGVCTSGRRKENNQRASAADIVAMPAFWLDVDYKSPHHKKPGIPETREQALAIIEAAPIQPTIIVESGAGFHGYWKFKELLTLDTDADREKAKEMNRGWHQFFRSQNPTIVFDSTFDISRVLRIPNTQNLGADAMCRVLRLGGPEYSPDDFVEYIPEQTTEKLTPLPITAQGGGKATHAKPDGTKVLEFPNIKGVFLEGQAKPRAPEQFDDRTRATIEAMSENSKFLGLLQNKPCDDSTDDMLAVRLYINSCINATPVINPVKQVCFDLISYLRHLSHKTQGDRAKAFRVDYCEETVRKVVQSTLPKGKVKSDAPKKSKRDDEELPDKTPDDAYIALEKYLGRPICNPIKYVGAEPQRYSLDVLVADGPESIKTFYFTVNELMNYRLFEQRWVAATNRAITKIRTQQDWRRDVLARLLPLFIEEELPEEVTEVGIVKFGLISYLVSTNTEDDRDRAQEARIPFWTTTKGKKELCFFFDRFKEHLFLHTKGENMTAVRIAYAFKALKFQKPVMLRFHGSTVREYVYIVPEAIVAELNKCSRRIWLAEQRGEQDSPEGDNPWKTQ